MITEQEREVFRALGLDPDAARPVGEETGFSSALWRVGALLVKRAHRAEDAAREALFYTTLAARTGLRLPRLHARDGDWLVFDWVDGEAGDGLIGAAPAQAEEVADALRSLVAVPLDSADRGALRTLLPDLAALLPRVEEGVVRLLHHFPEREALTRELPARITDAVAALAEAPEVLCHADLHVENLLFTADGIVLIDWQTVGRGPAALDVSRFIIEGLADPGVWRRWAPHAAALVPAATTLSLGHLAASRFLRADHLQPRTRALIARTLQAIAVVLEG